jgi:hypothetical protein
MKILDFFLFLWDFCPPRSGSRATQINADPDPKPWMIQDMVVMHLETERIFMNVALYRHVLVCGAPGCTTFVGRNSSLEDAQVKKSEKRGKLILLCGCGVGSGMKQSDSITGTL